MIFPAILCLCLVLVAYCGEQQQQEQTENEDYHLYDLLEKAQQHTGRPSLYALFKLPDNAAVSEVSKAFRQLSKLHHPDKKTSDSVSNYHSLLTAAHTVLKNEKSRKRLQWLLNDSPPWYRSTVYTARKYMKKQSSSSRFSVSAVLIGCVVFSVLAHFFTLWFNYAIAVYRVITSRREVSKLGKKEVKRMERKLAEAGPSRSMNNSPVQQLFNAQQEYPPRPSILQLWPFAMCQMIFQMILKKLKRD